MSGIYCLGNDRVLEWLIAFATSLRRHEPARRVIVIPFDDRVEGLRRLAEAFGFELLDDPVLERLDAIGRAVWPADPQRAGIMRKLAVFAGPLDRFLYLDADVVVLRPLEPYFAAVDRSAADVLYFRADIDEVYRPGSLRQDVPTVGFNTGVFAGRHGALTPAAVEPLVDRAIADMAGFADTAEQPFFNYWASLCGVTTESFTELVPEMTDAWAGMRIRRRGGERVLDDPRVPESGRPVSLVHWAGYRPVSWMPLRTLFVESRLSGRRSPLARFRFELRWLLSSLSAPRSAARELVGRLRNRVAIARASKAAPRPAAPGS
jgi:hypothetical protein